MNWPGCLRIEFFPRDLWVGVYVGELELGRRRVYICPIPTIVISFTLRSGRGQ